MRGTPTLAPFSSQAARDGDLEARCIGSPQIPTELAAESHEQRSQQKIAHAFILAACHQLKRSSVEPSQEVCQGCLERAFYIHSYGHLMGKMIAYDHMILIQYILCIENTLDLGVPIVRQTHFQTNLCYSQISVTLFCFVVAPIQT